MHVFNQRSVAEILRVIRTLGGMIGCEAKAAALGGELEAGLDAIRGVRRAAAAPAARLLRGMGRAADLLHTLGIGADRHRGRRRRVSRSSRSSRSGATASSPIRWRSPRRAPDLIFGSWCGKKFNPRCGGGAAGWQEVPAVRDGELHEVKSSIILQPGPAALTDGVRELHRVIAAWVGEAQG